ncbi:unnamed protein product, partial [Rotaria sp. Silwood2]
MLPINLHHGHGAAFDFPKATRLQRIGSSIYHNSDVIAAVCHGPAVFANLKEPSNINQMIEFTVVDGRLVSGVNPASASIVAQKAVEIVKGVH